MSHTLDVVRMQLINRMTFIWIPLLIVGGSFALSLVIFALIPVDAPKYSWALQAPLWYFVTVGVQAVAYTFPFSQAMSTTRRQFFTGTSLTAVLTAAFLAVIVAIGGAVEQSTNGWGMNGYYFRLPAGADVGPILTSVLFLVATLLLFFVGFVEATIYRRFGAFGVTLSLVGLGLLLVAVAWLATITGSWPAIGSAFDALGAWGIAGVGAVLVLALAGVSYLGIRRAIP